MRNRKNMGGVTQIASSMFVGLYPSVGIHPSNTFEEIHCHQHTTSTTGPRPPEVLGLYRAVRGRRLSLSKTSIGRHTATPTHAHSLLVLCLLVPYIPLAHAGLISLCYSRRTPVIQQLRPSYNQLDHQSLLHRFCRLMAFSCCPACIHCCCKTY